MERGLQGCFPEAASLRARSLDEQVEALRRLVAPLRQRVPAPRQERLSGVHNPWGHAATLVNAWPFLDLCESGELLDLVQAVIGPDIILWDSELFLDARVYQEFLRAGREGRYWPAAPLDGAVVLLGLGTQPAGPSCVDVRKLSAAALAGFDLTAGLYVVRYMSAASHFDRQIGSAPNWLAMQEQPLINYTSRPLWLVRGTDRGSSDFVTGFSPSVPMWASTGLKEK